MTPPRAVSAVCIPSTDTALSAAADEALARLDPVDPASLEAALRVLYPALVVRERELSAEHGRTLYVYREGTFVPSADASWADEPGIAWGEFDHATGRVLDANAALSTLFGVAGTMVGRLAKEFVPAGGDRLSDAQLRAIAESGGAHSTGLGRREDGTPLLVEFVAIVVGERIQAWYREAPSHPWRDA